MEGFGGIEVPYLGYVEATLQISEVDGLLMEDCLFLVVPNHNYGKRVPISDWHFTYRYDK